MLSSTKLRGLTKSYKPIRLTNTITRHVGHAGTRRTYSVRAGQPVILKSLQASYRSLSSSPRSTTSYYHRLLSTSIARLNSSENAAQPPPPPNEQRQPWIDVLESVADGPWLTNTVPDEHLRLSIAHGLMYQLLLYLSRPIEGKDIDRSDEQALRDAHAQYLSAFAVARVPGNSEMARARIATAKLVKAVLNQATSLPATSPIRQDAANAKLFETFGALKDVGDAHLTNARGVVEDWNGFWGHAQPIVVALAEELDNRGFMLKEDGAAKEGENDKA